MSAGNTISRIGIRPGKAKENRQKSAIALDTWWAMLDNDAQARAKGLVKRFHCPGIGHKITQAQCEERQRCAHLVEAIADSCEKCERFVHE